MSDMNNHEFSLFKEYVSEWIKTDNEIKEHQQKIRTLQQAKDTKLKPILDFMEKNNISELNTEKSGKISLEKTKKRSGVTKKTIREKLFLELDDNVAEKIFKDIYDSRTVKENTSLKRK